MQAHYPVHLARQTPLDSFDQCHELDVEDTALLQHVGLYYIAHLPKVMANKAMITALVEWWHSET